MHTKKRALYAYLFVTPFVVAFVSFSVYPILYSFYLSFCSYDALSGVTKFVGLQNYARLIQSGYFIESVFNTFIIWVISIIPQLTLALVLALLLDNYWIRGRNILRVVYYFPNLVTPVTIGVLFGAMFSYPGGVINHILKFIGLTENGIDFQNSVFLARLIIGIAVCWQHFGFNVIFFTSGLNSISQSIYEAAEVDGATAMQKTFKITLPLLKPILVYVMITSIIGGLQMFDIAKTIFKDVPGNKTTTMVKYMYETAFERWQLGYGAACAYGIFFIIMIFSLISLKISASRKTN